MNDYGMQVESLFAGINNITSIHATLRIKNELELRLRNTTKRITSLTFYNKKEISAKERTLSFNLLTNFIATLKHITIHMKVDYNGFDRFFKNTKQLESITVRTAIPIKILKYAQGIKHFKLYNDAQLPHIDRNVIQFIKQQNKLQSLSIIISPLRRIDASMFLAYLDRIIDAILVRRTVTQLILIVEVEVKLKDEFSQSFYKSLVKLENLDLNLNGIPIRNVLRDLSVIDDSMFQLVSSDSRNFVLKLTARSLTNIY